MSEKMTLAQVRDTIKTFSWAAGDEGMSYAEERLMECADAIDAHLATLPAAVQDAMTSAIDDALECMELHGMHSESAYKVLKAMLTQRGNAQYARNAARYRYLLSKMKVGAVTTQLPLYRAPYLYLSEPCDDVRHVEQAIDAAMLNDKELP